MRRFLLARRRRAVARSRRLFLEQLENRSLLASISISDVTVAEGDSGPVNAVFTVSIDAAPASNVTIRLDTGDGTAKAAGTSSEGGNDYVPRSNQTLTFTPAGPLTQTFTVIVNGD